MSFVLPRREALYIFAEAPERQKIACDGNLECLLNIVDEYQDLAVGPSAPEVLPDKIVGSSQDCVFLPGVRRGRARSILKGVEIGSLIGDQQGALVGNECFHQGEAKCTFGTRTLLFNTGNDVGKSNSGLLGAVGSPHPTSLVVYRVF